MNQNHLLFGPKNPVALPAAELPKEQENHLQSFDARSSLGFQYTSQSSTALIEAWKKREKELLMRLRPVRSFEVYKGKDYQKNLGKLQKQIAKEQAQFNRRPLIES